MADKVDTNADSIAELARLIPGGHLLPKPEGKQAAVAATEKAGTDTDDETETEGSETEDQDGTEGGDNEHPEETDGTNGTETETEEEEEEEEGEEGHSQLPESVQKRINKLTALRKTAEETLAGEKTAREAAEARARELEARLAEGGEGKAGKAAAASAPVTHDPLAGVTTAEELQARVEHATRVADWALTNLDGATIQAEDGSERYLESAEVRSHLVAAQQVLRAAPRKAALLEAQAADEAVARSINPEMWKAGTEAHKAFQEVLAVFPEIKRAPDFRSFIADWYAGFTARTAATAAAKAKKGGAPAVKVPQLAPPGPRGNAALKVPAKQVVEEGAKADVFKRGGSQDALTDYFLKTS